MALYYKKLLSISLCVFLLSSIFAVCDGINSAAAAAQSSSTGLTGNTKYINVSGYIKPDLTYTDSNLNTAFSVEAIYGGTTKKALTDSNGYFELKNVPLSETTGTIKISKDGYVDRNFSNINSDVCIGSQDNPVLMWAGDIVKDNSINISDIMGIATCFNSVAGDGRYQENCDFNKDTAININDIMIAVKNFNKTISDYPDVEINAADIVYCSTSEEIQNALTEAQPGQRIVIKSGEYTGKWINSSFFYSGSSGTQGSPITIESENPEDPAVLRGLGVSTGYVLYITGDYWQIRNLKVCTGQKGIMLDNSDNSVISGCEVYDTGNEGIHLRDGSSNNTVRNCNVHDTGETTAGYGEGIYVGSDKSKCSTFNKDCNNNTIAGCTLGPGISAEHVDIKEGTIGTVVENCTMNGTGISGQNYADSFIDVKGNDAVIRYNKCYRNNNSIIVDAFQVHQQLADWGLNNDFYGNTVNLDDASIYIVNAPSGTAKASNNTRIPAGSTYKGKVTEY